MSDALLHKEPVSVPLDEAIDSFDKGRVSMDEIEYLFAEAGRLVLPKFSKIGYVTTDPYEQRTEVVQRVERGLLHMPDNQARSALQRLYAGVHPILKNYLGSEDYELVKMNDNYRYAASLEVKKAGDPGGEVHRDLYPTVLVCGPGEAGGTVIDHGNNRTTMPFEPWTLLMFDGVTDLHWSEQMPEGVIDRVTLQLTYGVLNGVLETSHPRHIANPGAYLGPKEFLTQELSVVE